MAPPRSAGFSPHRAGRGERSEREGGGAGPPTGTSLRSSLGWWEVRVGGGRGSPPLVIGKARRAWIPWLMRAARIPGGERLAALPFATDSEGSHRLAEAGSRRREGGTAARDPEGGSVPVATTVREARRRPRWRLVPASLHPAPARLSGSRGLTYRQDPPNDVIIWNGLGRSLLPEHADQLQDIHGVGEAVAVDVGTVRRGRDEQVVEEGFEVHRVGHGVAIHVAVEQTAAGADVGDG